MVASVASCLQKIELWYPSFGLQAIDCDLDCLIYASPQVNEELSIGFLAFVGWKWGCQPFSFPCSKNVTHCRKEICSTCLSTESMPIMPIPSLRHGVVLFKICYNAVIVLSCALSCAMRLLQTNQHLSRLSFLQQWVGSGAASLSAAHVRKM